MFSGIFLSTCFIISIGAHPLFSDKPFPIDFLFGVATSAYQVEGAWNEDGKGPSIWDNITHSADTPVVDKSNGDVACDSYHQYKTDIDMLRYLGVNHYRMSIAWTRILPNGTGNVANEHGVKYYKNILKLLREHHIEPMVTLFHWDMPLALAEQGGIFNETFVEWYANYTRVCFREFGEHIKYWFTFNEPIIYCNRNNSGTLDYLCAYHLIKAHAAAYHVYAKEFRAHQKGKLSMVNNIPWFGPASNSTEDREASDRAMQFALGIWANPIYHGDWPEIVKERVANRSRLEGRNTSRLIEFTDDEKKFINGTNDFFSINIYNSEVVTSLPNETLEDPPTVLGDAGVQIVLVNNSGSWGIIPLFEWVADHYNKPHILITENGYQGTHEIHNDTKRIEYHESYLRNIRKAMELGFKVIGYTIWGLMDDFEWWDGYTTKFGLYQVDFNSTKRTRTPRDSAHWYKKVVHTRCVIRC